MTYFISWYFYLMECSGFYSSVAKASRITTTGSFRNTEKMQGLQKKLSGRTLLQLNASKFFLFFQIHRQIIQGGIIACTLLGRLGRRKFTVLCQFLKFIYFGIFHLLPLTNPVRNLFSKLWKWQFHKSIGDVHNIYLSQHIKSL